MVLRGGGGSSITYPMARPGRWLRVGRGRPYDAPDEAARIAASIAVACWRMADEHSDDALLILATGSVQTRRSPVDWSWLLLLSARLLVDSGDVKRATGRVRRNHGGGRLRRRVGIGPICCGLISALAAGDWMDFKNVRSLIESNDTAVSWWRCSDGLLWPYRIRGAGLSVMVQRLRRHVCGGGCGPQSTSLAACFGAEALVENTTPGVATPPGASHFRHHEAEAAGDSDNLKRPLRSTSCGKAETQRHSLWLISPFESRRPTGGAHSCGQTHHGSLLASNDCTRQLHTLGTRATYWKRRPRGSFPLLGRGFQESSSARQLPPGLSSSLRSRRLRRYTHRFCGLRTTDVQGCCGASLQLAR